MFESKDPLAALGALAGAWLDRLREGGCRVIDAMVAGKLLDLIDLPNLAVARGFAQKYHRAALAVLFVVNFHVVHFDGRHRSSS